MNKKLNPKVAFTIRNFLWTIGIPLLAGFLWFKIENESKRMKDLKLRENRLKYRVLVIDGDTITIKHNSNKVERKDN